MPDVIRYSVLLPETAESRPLTSTVTLPCVLVLVAARNGAPWIEQQILSVLAQRQVAVMVHVFDDLSADNTVELVRAMARTDDRIELTTTTVASGSAGANFRRAIQAADVREATHVAFCDQDDVWAHDKLEVACKTLAMAESDLYSSAVTAVWPNGERKHLSQSNRCKSNDYLFEGAGQGCTFVLTTSFFQRVRAFVSSHSKDVAVLHYHDWLIYALARVWRHRWIYDAKSHLEYLQHGANDTGARGRLNGITHRAGLIRSQWYERQVLAMMNVCALATGGSESIDAVRMRMQSSKQSLRGRISWCCYLLLEGRRRLSDRIVLCVSAALGFL